MGEKTEKPTQKKLRDAKKKGQVAKAQDFPAAFTFVVSMGTTLALTQYLYNHFTDFLLSCFKLVTQPNIEDIIGAIFYQSFYIIALCSMPVLLIVSIVGVISTFLTVGPVWAPEVFKLDVKKFNPVDNLKSKFKMKTLVELVKQLLKIGVASVIVYMIMMDHMGEITQTAGMPMLESLALFVSILKEVILKVGIFFVFIAVADLMYQKHAFEKEMMMEKFEIKQEYKDSEGDPLIKSKRKQVAHEIAYQEGPAGAASRAQAVVTNPTHIAIALGYERELDPCPFILAMGQGILAEQIISIAEKNKVPIMRNIPLAHKLWDEGKLFEYIPEDTYELVAEVMKWIASLQEETINTTI